MILKAIILGMWNGLVFLWKILLFIMALIRNNFMTIVWIIFLYTDAYTVYGKHEELTSKDLFLFIIVSVFAVLEYVDNKIEKPKP
jgi:hypothetical protein